MRIIQLEVTSDNGKVGAFVLATPRLGTEFIEGMKQFSAGGTLSKLHAYTTSVCTHDILQRTKYTLNKC
jgi:hypothetical protein